MKTCQNQSENLSKCTCSYDCSTRGLCCECLHYHLSMKQLPGCCFPREAEATYDRSFRKFVQVYQHLLK